MSKRAFQRFTANVPIPPKTAQVGDEQSKFFAGIVSWMQQMALAYNRSVESTQRDRANTSSVIPIYDQGGTPTQIYYAINAYLGQDKKFYAQDTSKSAWAMRFSLTSDIFELLYCASGVSPLVWTMYMSVTSAGTAILNGYQPVDSDLTALSALTTTGIAARTGSSTWTTRTITGTTNQVTVTNGGGVAGNPTLALPQDIHASAVPVFAGFRLPVASKTANYTLTAADWMILLDVSGGNATITLPASTGISGRAYVVKRTDNSANTATLAADGSETIDGVANKTLPNQYDKITVVSDGLNWYVV